MIIIALNAEEAADIVNMSVDDFITAHYSTISSELTSRQNEEKAKTVVQAMNDDPEIATQIGTIMSTRVVIQPMGGGVIKVP
jgi:hypothetical protein